MRPTYLSIEGINSFVQKQEIDFELLSDNNIFCVYGATGSGKTTILDSIILALYGGGDRGEIADYINLSCDKGEIVYRFLLDDKLYEVEKRITRKNGTTRAFLRDKTSDVILAEGSDSVKREIEKMLGLNASEFTQVIILEQGKFAKFLKADKSKRSRTVSGLFSLERFDGLSTRFNERVKMYSHQLALIEVELKNLDYAVIENLENTKVKTEQFFKAEKDLEERLNLLKKRLEADAASKAKYEMRVSSSESLKSVKGQLKAKFDEAEKLKVEQGALEVLKKEANEAQILFKNSELFLGKIEHLEKDLPTYKVVENEKNLLLERYRQNDIKNKNIQDEIKEKEERLKKICYELEPFNVVLKTSDGIDKVDAILNGLQEDFPKLQLEIQRLENMMKEKEALVFKLEECIKAEGENDGALKNCNERLLVLRAEISRHERLLSEAEKECKRLQMMDLAASVASGLNEGDACPVCGGEFRGFKDGAKIDLEEEERRVEELRVKLGNNTNELARFMTLAESAEKERKRILSERTLIDGQIKDIPSDLESGLSFKKGELGRVKSAANLMGEALGILRKSEALNADLRLVLSERESVITDGKRLGERLDDFFKSVEVSLSLEQGLKKVSEACEALGSLKERKLNERAAAEGIVRRFEERTLELAEREVQLNRDISALLAKAEEIERVLKSVEDVVFDLEENLLCTEKKNTLESELKEVVSQKAVAISEFKRIEVGMAERERVLKEHKRVSQLKDTASELYKLTMGNKFLEFVQEDLVEQFTLEASNRLFSLTNGKFTLEYNRSKKHGFEVKDYLRGGETRSINTLSGGETFLASISMAMAISRLLAAKQKFDFFFLDEGFGTLDENAIDVASEALYALSTDTLVGVVTHRKELVEKIARKLLVVAATEGVGTRVVCE